MKLPVHVVSRVGRVQAFCPDLPGVSASGSTEGEALALLRARIDDFFHRSSRVATPGARVVQLEV